ncbi:oxidoreductase [Nocardia camponoti]|uniref:Oxidoreductase n=1 Tax=Nocardia camponoti TaxID=1616106 RepID=A0A917Q703_9NOCA|nr:oxidoreductase [Nocardia camponoti]
MREVTESAGQVSGVREMGDRGRLADRIARLYAEDEQVRAAQPSPDAHAAITAPGRSLGEIVDTVFAAYAERPAVGFRRTEVVVDSVTGRSTRRVLPVFDTLTYSELGERVSAIVAAWHAAGIGAGDVIAVGGFTGPDYLAIDLAIIRLGAVAVPLQSGAGPARWRAILAETAPRVLAVDVAHLGVAVEAGAPELLVFDFHGDDDEHRDALAAARERDDVGGIRTLPDLFDEYARRTPGESAMGREQSAARYVGRTPGGSAAGSEQSAAPAQPTVPPLSMTSANSAAPAQVDAPSPNSTPQVGASSPDGSPHSDVSAPDSSPHAETDDEALALLIYTSGSTGTPKGAMYSRRLVAHAWRFVRPQSVIDLHFLPMSHIAGRMSLAKTLARGGTAYFAAAQDMSSWFDDVALVRPTEIFVVPRICEMIFARYNAELARRTNPANPDPTVAEQVRADIRTTVLGGRVINALCGSAPIAAPLRAFMEELLELRLHDGYGSTEAGSPLIVNSRVMRPPVLDYKLVDVPELGYFSTDIPSPRGELLLKTATMISGYFRRPDLNAEIFDADGFYRTGDIVAELAPDHLVYLDRRNNVLKLAQGEFVTIAKLESVFATAELVRQIFVYGNSTQSSLLAVIVPSDEALRLPPEDLRASLRASLLAVADDLEPYEILRDFLVEPEPFTVDNGLLSGIGKPLRPKLTERYGPSLEELYTKLAQDQQDEVQALRADAAGLPVLETVARAARAILGCESPDSEAHFADLGGDSLAALSYSRLLTELLDVDVPVSTIVAPTATLAAIADYVDRERKSDQRVTAATIHGRNSATIAATDVALSSFIDTDLIANAPTLPLADDPQTVLVTGANGYLGRFLALTWLERLAPRGGKIICVIRATDDDTARARLLAVFDTDPILAEKIAKLAPALEVRAGDVAEPEFGLAQGEWAHLANEVDHIVHSAALVNHVLPYAQLFGPNVIGTAEVIKLAVTSKRKSISFLSTVAVAAQCTNFSENGDIATMSPTRVVDDSYANGYGNSKWAAEVLLREASARMSLPVTVFRSDMILAHRDYPGQVNVPDLFTRLLLSVLRTGLAPRSFYRPGRAHYDGLPADFVATAIVELSGAPGHRAYNVVNPHDDAISLDTFVDWLIEAGHPITRVDDYADWLARFETALRAMPEVQRAATVLPLLHAFRRPAPARAGSALPADDFHQAIGTIPHLSRELIGKYVTDLAALRLLTQ